MSGYYTPSPHLHCKRRLIVIKSSEINKLRLDRRRFVLFSARALPKTAVILKARIISRVVKLLGE